MSIALRLRHSIPFVKPFPLISLKVRWHEKTKVVKNSFGFGGARKIGLIDGNAILSFNTDCEVASKGQLFQLPEDKMIFNHVKVFGEWGGIESDFLATKIQELLKTGLEAGRVVFIDLGANVGLVTTQTMRRVPSEVRCIAIEPVPALVRALNFNLESLTPGIKVKILPLAIGNVSGSAKFVIDQDNYGSSCLSVEGQGSMSNHVIDVPVLSSQDFANTELKKNQSFVLKSDIEGFDCSVLAAFPDWVWENLYAGVIEVTSDSRSDLSELPTLLAQLEKFRFLSWDAKMSELVSVSGINEYWRSKSNAIRNLYFVK